MQARVDGSNKYANSFNNSIIQWRDSSESLIAAVNVSEKKNRDLKHFMNLIWSYKITLEILSKQ